MMRYVTRLSKGDLTGVQVRPLEIDVRLKVIAGGQLAIDLKGRRASLEPLPCSSTAHLSRPKFQFTARWPFRAS